MSCETSFGKTDYSSRSLEISQKVRDLSDRLQEVSKRYEELLQRAVREPNFISLMELTTLHTDQLDRIMVHQVMEQLQIDTTMIDLSLLESIGFEIGNEAEVDNDELLEPPANRFVAVGIEVHKVFLEAVKSLVDVQLLEQKAEEGFASELSPPDRFNHEINIGARLGIVMRLRDDVIALKQRAIVVYNRVQMIQQLREVAHSLIRRIEVIGTLVSRIAPF